MLRKLWDRLFGPSDVERREDAFNSAYLQALTRNVQEQIDKEWNEGVDHVPIEHLKAKATMEAAESLRANTHKD